MLTLLSYRGSGQDVIIIIHTLHSEPPPAPRRNRRQKMKAIKEKNVRLMLITC